MPTVEPGDGAPLLSSMPRTPLLLHTLFDRCGQLQPHNLFVERTHAAADANNHHHHAFPYHAVTMAQHAQQARVLAGALARAGVAVGDRVGTFCWNSNRHLLLYHAVPCMRAVLHPLNIRLGGADLDYIIRDAHDVILVADHDLLPRLAAMSAAGLASLRCGVVVCGAVRPNLASPNDVPAPPPPPPSPPVDWVATSAAAAELARKLPTGARVVDWAEFMAAAAPPRNQTNPFAAGWPEDLDEHEACGLCYTSGTTGRPKAVAYSHRSTYLHTLAAVAPDSHNLSGADTLLPVVPFFHANGWGLPHEALMLGARLLNHGAFNDADTVLAMAADWGATFSAAVPTVWQAIRQRLAAAPARYVGKIKLARVICGGTAPPNEMMRWFKQHWDVPFAQGWGMTETSPLGTTALPVARHADLALSEEAAFENVQIAGTPPGGVELRVVDSEDFSRALPRDGVAQGELLVRGPWVACSYFYGSEGGGSFVQPGGWLATGDVASIDPTGRLLIRDRSKDVIKTGGEWISSKDLENAVAEVAGVAQCAVVAQPHPRWDERPVAVLVLDDCHDPAPRLPVTLAAVREHCAATFAKFQLPDDLVVWDALPLTGTGKVSKKDIRAKLKAQGYVLPELRPAPAARL